MSLARWITQNAGKLSPELLELVKAHKGKAMALGGGAAALGAGYAAQPMVDDFMTDQAMKSVGRSGKRAVFDALDYAEEHPYAAAAILGGTGLAGAKLGEEGFAGLADSISPVKFGGMLRKQKPAQGRQGGY